MSNPITLRKESLDIRFYGELFALVSLFRKDISLPLALRLTGSFNSFMGAGSILTPQTKHAFLLLTIFSSEGVNVEQSYRYLI